MNAAGGGGSVRTLIVADIHANLTAFEAVLATQEARSCDRVISLGDHTNFGPQPRQVHERLTSLGALMLRGNHEDRLLHMDDPSFSAYNWTLLQWTHRQLQGIDMRLPVDVREGQALYTHGTPGDPFHLVYPEDMPAILDALPEGVTHLLSGHNHKPWLVEHEGRTACNPGSLGMLEDDVGGTAPFVVMEEKNGEIRLTRHSAAYDVAALKRAFLDSGCVQAAPEMSRIVLHTMLTGEYQATLKLIRFVSETAKPLGLTMGDREAWQAADRALPWREKIVCAEYWRRIKEEVL